MRSFTVKTNNTFQTDTSCCKMKSVKGYCPKPIEMLSSFLSKKWAISILITIANFEHLRFNDLRNRLEKITAKTLTDRLKELDREGIIQRKAYNEIPPRVEYNLTKKGKRLTRCLLPLIKWAEQQEKQKEMILSRTTI